MFYSTRSLINEVKINWIKPSFSEHMDQSTAGIRSFLHVATQIQSILTFLFFNQVGKIESCRNHFKFEDSHNQIGLMLCLKPPCKRRVNLKIALSLSVLRCLLLVKCLSQKLDDPCELSDAFLFVICEYHSLTNVRKIKRSNNKTSRISRQRFTRISLTQYNGAG